MLPSSGYGLNILVQESDISARNQPGRKGSRERSTVSAVRPDTKAVRQRWTKICRSCRRLYGNPLPGLGQTVMSLTLLAKRASGCERDSPDYWQYPSSWLPAYCRVIQAN